MPIVVDANILFAALLKDSSTRRLLLSRRIVPVTSEFVLDEFNKHIAELSQKTGLDKGQLGNLLGELLESSKIKIVPKDEIKQFMNDATSISPDKDDVPYFALALKLQCPIWSNDKKLKEQSVVKISNTEELVKLLR
jgi:predicted nucleic acid-binding protein